MAQDIEKENEHQEKDQEKQDTEHETEYHVRYRGKECKRIAWIGALMLRVGDPVEVVVRGRIDNTIQGRFWCYNESFGWLWIKTSDNDVIIKIKDVKYLRKLKR